MAKQVPPSSPLVGTWRLAPEAGALGVGPGLNDVSWWSNSSDDVATRACLFDDDYVFNADASSLKHLLVEHHYLLFHKIQWLQNSTACNQ